MIIAIPAFSMNSVFIYVWMMAFVRAGGLLALCPVFSGQNVPMQIRVAIAGMLAWFATGTFHGTMTVPVDLVSLIITTAHELGIGLLMGFGMRIVFYAIDFAGQVISTEIGLTMSSDIDPISRTSSSAIGIALSYFVALLFLISGCHHAMFAAFIRSFDLAPIGQMSFNSKVAEFFVASTGKIFLIAVQMAAPMIAANFVVNFSFSILARAAPGIHSYSESFGVRIIAGLTLFGMTIGLTAQIVLNYLRGSPELVLRLLP